MKTTEDKVNDKMKSLCSALENLKIKPAMKTKNQKVKLIREAYEKLRGVFYSSMRDYARELFEQCRTEEKAHRGFGPDFNTYHPTAISVADSAKLFAVKRVAEYLLKPETYPKGQHYLHYHKSCFIAAGIADEFRNKVIDAWGNFSLPEFAELDYVEFVEAPKTEVV